VHRDFDPVLVEVINHELGAITEEMAIVIWRTSQSPMLKSGDFATAVCDPRGRVIGQGFAAPFQLAAFNDLMVHVLARYGSDFARGDVIITNDPYAGMTHMPDFAVVVPVVVDAKTVAFCLAYSHHSDVGGRFPGSASSQCLSTYEEGLRIPIVKLVERGQQTEAIVDIVRANVRVPDEWRGDMDAKIAGCLRGAEQTEQLVKKHGLDRYMSACDFVIEYAERSMRAAISQAPDGTYSAQYVVPDDGATDDGRILLQLALQIAGDHITVDFGGSSPQVPGALNTPLTMTKAAVYGALKAIISPDVPTNDGFFRPVHVTAPLGSVLNPRFPAAVAGRAPIFFRIFDMVYAALSQALPGRVPVMGEGGDLLHFSGQSASHEPFAFVDLYFGGWGARPDKDGIDGVAPVYMGSYGCVSAELLEAQFPIVVDGFGFVPDSEGAGRYRGSVAIYRQWRFRAPGHAMVRSVRLGPSPGLGSGSQGAPARTVLERRGEKIELGGKTHIHVDLEAGDRLYHATAGAGGYGNPWLRDPRDVLTDCRAGIISIAGARERYGVALDPSGEIDWTETERLRASRGMVAGIATRAD
jgi:N-methylhydantoinase B